MRVMVASHSSTAVSTQNSGLLRILDMTVLRSLDGVRVTASGCGGVFGRAAGR